ncbi:hypothetical protein NP233_g11991 [Leucocoprinus birnbaumii]|uniref:Uncharacterized protein n=1 Tax=Leucocoprinus birnbaumii TaxID=56174 RepID=A0AAD5VFD2_9AGAR|nr:hypothetical protein NP233_g11991 [Leucocoprinus birnbaumii]
MFDLPLPADSSLYPAASWALATIFTPPSTTQLPVFQVSQPSSGPTVAMGTIYTNPLGGELSSKDQRPSSPLRTPITSLPQQQPVPSATLATGQASCLLPRPPATPHKFYLLLICFTAAHPPLDPQKSHDQSHLTKIPRPTPAFLERTKLIGGFSTLNVAHPSYSALEDKAVDVTTLPPLELGEHSDKNQAAAPSHIPAVIPPDSPNYKRPGDPKPRAHTKKVAGSGPPQLHLISEHPAVGGPLSSTPEHTLCSQSSSKRLAMLPPHNPPSSKVSHEDLSRNVAQGSHNQAATSAQVSQRASLPDPTPVPPQAMPTPKVSAVKGLPPTVAGFNLFGLENGKPFLELVSHLFTKSSLDDLGPTGELKCLSCIIGFSENCEIQAPIEEPTTGDLARASKHSLILDVLLRLSHIATEWDEVHHAKATLDCALAQYQHSVSEFAEELLTTDEYFANTDPDFWVDIGLTHSQESAVLMLKTARNALDGPKGMSSRDATYRLYNVHAAAALGLVDQDTESFSIDLPKPLNWNDHHDAVAAQFSLPKPPKAKLSKKGADGKGKAKAW